MIDEFDPRAINRPLDDKQYALDHFPMNLFTLEKKMKTDVGKKRARSLSLFLEDFKEGMIHDHQARNKASCHFQIAKAFYQAGEKKAALFNLEDPFASKRNFLEPDKYALDGLLNCKTFYIQKFLDQLKFELNGYQL